MKNEIWKMFELTGNVESYLYYKSNVDTSTKKDKKEYNNIGEITTIE